MLSDDMMKKLIDTQLDSVDIIITKKSDDQFNDSILVNWKNKKDDTIIYSSYLIENKKCDLLLISTHISINNIDYEYVVEDDVDYGVRDQLEWIFQCPNIKRIIKEEVKNVWNYEKDFSIEKINFKPNKDYLKKLI